MSEEQVAATETDGPPSGAPPSDMRGLDVLVGTWRVQGGAEGIVTFEWMDGEHFLLQRVELEQFGQPIHGLEIIGHNRDFGADPDEEIRSCFYDNTGNTLRYVYELEGDTLTIWGGEKGSPANYTGSISADGGTIAGAWVYPGGGGYRSTMTRVSGAVR